MPSLQKVEEELRKARDFLKNMAANYDNDPRFKDSWETTVTTTTEAPTSDMPSDKIIESEDRGKSLYIEEITTEKPENQRVLQEGIKDIEEQMKIVEEFRLSTTQSSISRAKDFIYGGIKEIYRSERIKTGVGEHIAVTPKGTTAANDGETFDSSDYESREKFAYWGNQSSMRVWKTGWSKKTTPTTLKTKKHYTWNIEYTK